uniref:cGMPdependent 3' putative n=1 Tax=Albugo laibachii Nc14 TaxID=890382 RepID=F0W6D6_9STRA|nr:cGMPdependent 3' putative [Albugo laibachii Nc14]|eukprot:CCA16680.1 cGMPdependent 3' putative [Albugo laibachii Nc14]
MSQAESLEIIHLGRGGLIVLTSIGPIQFGMPPETIKDSMKLGIPVPRHYIVPSEPFTKTIGANMGVNVAEFEFPAYCNFFFKAQSINLIVSSNDVEDRIRTVFQETLFGPVKLNLEQDFPPSTPKELYPDLHKELEYFRKFGDTLITLDKLIQFTNFNDDRQAWIKQDDRQICIESKNGSFCVVDGKKTAVFPDSINLPLPSIPRSRTKSFHPPQFGVTVLGNSHGFDPDGKTSGYVLWINHRGIMIDPPSCSSSILGANNMPAVMIDGVILTHCHADHDAGTFQKILQEGRVSLITTPTIYQSFLRKYSALSGFKKDFLKRVLDFRRVRINDPITIRGAEFRFFYTLHSIPCVGFEVSYGDKRIVFSGDHLNDVERIKMLHDNGILSVSRYQELVNFPWHCDLILHEAGVPPIHTPLKTLMNLDQDIRDRLYVVHTASKDLSAGCGLRAAPEGVENTIVVETKAPEHAGALEILDLVRKIDLFSELSFSHAYEILQMAKRKTYEEGNCIKEEGDIGDTFYIIIVGNAQVFFTEEKSRPIGQGKHDFPTYSEQQEGDPANSLTDRRDAPLRAPFSKTFRPGEYFDLQTLLTPGWILPYRAVAKYKVSVLEFNATEFNWFLQKTTAFERMKKLIQARLHSSYTLLQSNRILCKFTPTQRTRFEILLVQKEVVKDQVLWNAGDPCTCAFLIDKGQFRLRMMPTHTNETVLVGSHMHMRRTSCSASSKRTLHINSDSMACKNERRNSASNGNAYGSADSSEKVLTHGNFVGDVDKIMSTVITFQTSELTAESKGTVFAIRKDDLRIFLTENPGILMRLSGTIVVT